MADQRLYAINVIFIKINIAVSKMVYFLYSVMGLQKKETLEGTFSLRKILHKCHVEAAQASQ